MARDIYELDTLGVVALLQQGKPVNTSVEFTFKMDGADFPDGKGVIKGELVADPAAKTGKAATCKFSPPEVPPDKPSYLLEYSIKVDGQVIGDRSQFTVWPKKGKLTAIRDDDGKAFPGFQFSVVQNGKPVGKPYATAGDPAVIEFNLDKGYAFDLANADPYEIKSKEKNGSALRDLKAKGVLNFTAEFVKPIVPAEKKLQQWVNQPATAEKGRDGLGSKILFQVGVKGDRNPDGTARDPLIGKAGLTVFVKVKFGPDPGKSKRNSPKTELLAGGNASDVTAVTDGVEYTGKVDLAAPGGVGEFEVELGFAGGDTCEVSIGSTPACADGSVVITNWRKIWYELMAPDFMELENRADPVLGNVRDFAAAGLTNIKTSGDNTFVAYELFKSHSFTEAEAEATSPGSVMKREFFELTAGNAKVYVLTDRTFKNYPKNFDKTKGLLATCLKACDINLYSDGPGTDDPIDRQFSATGAAADYDIWAADRGIYWLPKSGFDGSDTIRSIGWAADIATPDTYMKRPTVEFEADEHREDADKNHRTVTVQETLQGQSVDVSYPNPAVGNIATDVDATRKAALDAFLTGLYAVPTLRANANKLKFKVVGLTGNERRTARIQAVKDYLTSKVGSSAPKIPAHPGLDDAGAVRTGNLAWATVVNMDRSHHHKIAIDLPSANPTDPGSFVGALSDTKCPIAITISFEPHHGGNGLAGQGAQKGEILVRWGINCPLCITDTFLHELGHQYNMSAYNIAADAHAPGLRKPKSTAEDEDLPEYKNVGDKGHYYNRHGHSGNHCAWGINDADKALGSYGGLVGTCTMYGEGPRDDARRKRLAFCKQCTDYIRARDLSALK